MISFSKLLLGQEHFGDSLRYDPKSHAQNCGMESKPMIYYIAKKN